MKLGLKSQVALVTGGGQGVGRQICIELAREGARVVVNDLFPERAQAVAREIEAQGGQALAAPADITQADQVQAMVDAAARHFDAPVQILVNNAGIIPERREKGGRTPAFVDMPVADWAKIVNLNVYGTFHCCHAVLPGMVAARRGRIVDIISEAGRIGEANMAVYSGAKADIAGLPRRWRGSTAGMRSPSTRSPSARCRTKASRTGRCTRTRRSRTTNCSRRW